MIAFVRGEVAALTLTSAVIDVGGVGLDIACTPSTLAALRTGQRATLPTSLVVREESLTLFGFADEDERSVFELVQTASGVGPKLAQAMLAVLPPDDIRAAVAHEDVPTLTRVPGIGQKGAQRIILELRDRLGAPVGSRRRVSEANGQPAWRDQVRQGLLGLGWSQKEAEQALDRVAAEELPDEEAAVTAGQTPSTPDVGALLRAALRTLSKA